MDHDRTNMLIAKFPDIMAPRPPDPAPIPTVQTVIAAERLEGRAFTRGTDWNQWLFDPDRNPKMHAVATKAHRELREAIARGDVDCDNPNHPGEVLVHFVGGRAVHAVPRGPSSARFAAALRRHDATQPLCDEANCNIRISDECGPSTMLMSLLFGGVLLVFECCAHCHHVARETAEVGYKLGVMAAHERLAEMPLPPWARTAPWWLRWRASWARWIARVTGPTAP